MLTIVGYSINATIVIFDRIRENLKKMGSRADLTEIVNVGVYGRRKEKPVRVDKEQAEAYGD